uniref:F-box protein At3g07870-like n=1 Tax=Papaver somniferum TaxID=3469 RepID=A0A5B7LL48_PAPSO|nr:F-box protein At3g07870-like [Papaver somniferum]
MLPDLTPETLHLLPSAQDILASKFVCKEWNYVLADKRIGLLFGFTQKVTEEKVTQLFYREQIEEEDYYTMMGDFYQMLFGNNGTWNIIRSYDENMSHPIVGSCNSLIVSFNLENETFQSHSPPPHHIYENGGFSTPKLGMVFSGVHLLFYNIHDIYDLRIDFWAPISDNDIHARATGVEWNWELKRSIVLEEPLNLWWPPYKLIALGKNNDVLFQNNRCLTCYNELSRTLTKIAEIRWEKVRVIPHMRSAVSLRNFGGQSETCTDDDHATNIF